MRGLVGFRKGRDARARLTEVSDGFSMRLIANDGFRLNQGFQVAVAMETTKMHTNGTRLWHPMASGASIHNLWLVLLRSYVPGFRVKEGLSWVFSAKQYSAEKHAT